MFKSSADSLSRPLQKLPVFQGLHKSLSLSKESKVKITCVVSLGGLVCCLLQSYHTSTLAKVLHVDSRGDLVRRLSQKTCTASLVRTLVVISNVFINVLGNVRHQVHLGLVGFLGIWQAASLASPLGQAVRQYVVRLHPDNLDLALLQTFLDLGVVEPQPSVRTLPPLLVTSTLCHLPSVRYLTLSPALG